MKQTARKRRKCFLLIAPSSILSFDSMQETLFGSHFILYHTLVSVLGTGGESDQKLNRALTDWIWGIFGSICHRGMVLLAMQTEWFLMWIKESIHYFFTFSTTALQFKLIEHSDHCAFTMHRCFYLYKMQDSSWSGPEGNWYPLQ